MRLIEEDAVNAGVRIVDLMERAGRAVADAAAARAGGSPVTVLCGTGMNGGDGFVAARHLARAGVPVTVFSLADEADLKGAAHEAYQALHYGTSVTPIVLSDDKFGLLRRSLQASRVVVDALLGIGLTGEVRGTAVRAIEVMNALASTVVSADVPSGLDADTGRTLGRAVRADVTITFTCQKPGLVLYPGAEQAGEVIVADVGIPDETVARHTSMRLTDAADAAGLWPVRPADAHKGTCGRVLVVAGSTGMTGAAVLTSRAALRSGSGLVTLALPVSLNAIAEAHLTEEMTLPVTEAVGGRGVVLATRALHRLGRFAEGCDAVAIGPGLGREEGTLQLVRDLLARVTCPVVVDADGLYALAGHPEAVAGRAAPTVLTPHWGEAAVLLGAEVAAVREDSPGAAALLAEEYGATVVLKGARTVIATAGEIRINLTGNPGMATAGTGDCLTGMITGFLAQGLGAHDAAVLAAYVHGLSGDLAAAHRTAYCLVASDIIDFLPEAIRAVLSPGTEAG